MHHNKPGRLLAAVACVLVATGVLFGVRANQAQDIEQAYRTDEHLVAVKALFDRAPKSAVGETIVYPGGTPAEINAVLITISPGEKTSWHKHGVPLFVYVMSGVLDVDYGDKGVRQYAAGTAFMEAMDHHHRGMNNGDTPVSVLAVYMGADGAENVSAE